MYKSPAKSRVQGRDGTPRDAGGAVELAVVVIAVAIGPANLVTSSGQGDKT